MHPLRPGVISCLLCSIYSLLHTEPQAARIAMQEFARDTRWRPRPLPRLYEELLSTLVPLTSLSPFYIYTAVAILVSCAPVYPCAVLFSLLFLFAAIPTLTGSGPMRRWHAGTTVPCWMRRCGLRSCGDLHKRPGVPPGGGGKGTPRPWTSTGRADET